MTRYVLCRKSLRPGSQEEYLYVRDDFLCWFTTLEANCLWSLPNSELVTMNTKPGYEVYWRPVTMTLGERMGV